MKHLNLTLIGLLCAFGSFGLTPISGPTTICVGTSATLTDPTPGGSWASSSSTVIAVGASTGVITGIAAGVATITYTVGGSYVTYTDTVAPAPGVITGTPIVCVGGTTTLADVTTGGTWVSSSPAIAVASMSGVVTGYSAGSTTISYVLPTGCAATKAVTVSPVPALYNVTGGGSYCSGGSGVSVDLDGSSTGINYQLYLGTSAVGTAVAGTGAPLSFGVMTSAGIYTVVASSTLTTCTSSMNDSAVVTINSLPVSFPLTGTTSSCSAGGPGESIGLASSSTGNIYQLYMGGTTYGTPITGTGASLFFGSVTAPGTYTMVAIDPVTGCASNMMGSVTVTGNFITGYITYTGSSSDSLKVWLVQFNPSDSSIAAEDSTYACMATGTPYYQFSDKVAGSYMVKVALVGAVPGTSGYIPTYSLSTPHWDSAASIAHTSGDDTMHVNMIYGTVPAGPGFISGYVVSGAGRGTSGEVPAANMLVYLKDATGHIITYVYTDATGAYTFSSLANGSYTIVPESYKYYTTPSAVITLSTAAETAAGVNFKQHTTYGTITPFFPTTSTPAVLAHTGMSVYPNPTTGNLFVQWPTQATGTAQVVITDVLGREVLNTNIDIKAGGNTIDMNTVKDGIYLVTIKNDKAYYSGKVVKQ